MSQRVLSSQIFRETGVKAIFNVKMTCAHYKSTWYSLCLFRITSLQCWQAINSYFISIMPVKKSIESIRYANANVYTCKHYHYNMANDVTHYIPVIMALIYMFDLNLFIISRYRLTLFIFVYHLWLYYGTISHIT